MTAESKPAIPIWGVRHVAIRVKDIEAARRWYEDVLGMTVEDEFPGRALFVRFGPYYHHDLAIFQADEKAAAPDQNSVGLAHIALLIDSLEGVKQWYQHLKSKGVDVRGSDHGVTRSIYFTEPGRQPVRDLLRQPGLRLAQGRADDDRAAGPRRPVSDKSRQ